MPRRNANAQGWSPEEAQRKRDEEYKQIFADIHGTTPATTPARAGREEQHDGRRSD